MTGKNSGKHGIFEFLEHGHDPLGGRVNSSRAIQAKLVWEIAEQHGKTTVAGGVPMSYPRAAGHAIPRFFPGRFSQPRRRARLRERPGALCRAGESGRPVSTLVDSYPRWRQ